MVDLEALSAMRSNKRTSFLTSKEPLTARLHSIREAGGQQDHPLSRCVLIHAVRFGDEVDGGGCYRT
jgi:hypothetical protein